MGVLWWCWGSYFRVCELLTRMHIQRHNFLGPRPMGPWGVAKRSIIIKSQLVSQFQRFLKSNFVCLFTYERYETYQIGFLFDRLGHAPGLGLWGYCGGWGIFFSEIQPELVCELLP